jgi:hypothetical protein
MGALPHMFAFLARDRQRTTLMNKLLKLHGPLIHKEVTVNMQPALITNGGGEFVDRIMTNGTTLCAILSSTNY